MARYYFDLMEKDGLTVDDEGREFVDMEAAEREAARGMSDAAADMFARPIAAEGSSIEVRDDLGLVVRVRLKIEIERFRRR